jgi:hypothetical protein
VTPTKEGTGSLVTSSRLLTCEHVVDDVESGDVIRCTFRKEVREQRTATIVA